MIRFSRVLVVVAASLLLPSVADAAGFANVPQTPGELLSGLLAPEQGRTALIAYHNGVLYTVPEVPSSQPGADNLVRTWDLANPRSPILLSVLELTPMPINAHGYFKSGDYLIVGPNWPPGGEWSFRVSATFGVNDRVPFPDLDGAGVRGQLFQPWYVGDTFWSYNVVGGMASISLRGNQLSSWDHLGDTGVIGHPFLIGDLLIFASDQSRTGVATYDVSDPTNPVLLDVLTTGGPGGYWPELWGGDGRLLVVFPYRTAGNGIRVVDATDPANLQFVTDQPLPGAEAMYLQFQDGYGFTGDHKVDMRTFQSVLDLDGANVAQTNGPGIGVDTSQFALPLGNLLITGGIGPNEGMAVWAHQAAPDTVGPTVGFHIPQAGRTNYPLGAPISLLIHETLETATMVNGTTFIVRPVGGSAISGRMTYAFDDILTFTPDQLLTANTTYEVVLPDGGIEDAAGNGMVGYAFTFSTGGTVGGGNRPPVVDAFTVDPYPVTLSVAAALDATVSDPDGGPLEVRFDFGDGTPRTPWSSVTSLGHIYVTPGHYQALVQVRDPAGAIASARTTVTVVEPPTGPSPTHSTPITCGPGGLATVNPDNDTISFVNGATVSERAVCDDPRSITPGPSSTWWVACHDDDAIWVLDQQGVGVANIATGYGSAPVGIVSSPDGQTVYVSLAGRGELRRYDASTRTETGRLALGPHPRAIAVTPDGARVLVTRFLSAKDHAEVWSVDAASFTLTSTIVIGKFGTAENFDTTASGRGVLNQLVAIAIAPAGDRAWVVGNKPNTEKGLFFADDLDPDNSVRNVVVQLDLTTDAVISAIDLDNSDSASAVAFSPLGDYLFVTLQGNDQVQVLDVLAADTVTGLGAFVTRFGTGAAPQGVCIGGFNGTYVKNLLDRSITFIETDPFFRYGDKTVSSSELATVANETLSANVLAGKRIFYGNGDPRMSIEGYLSCASCHLDGGHDGRVWDFTGRGEGFRNTTSLRGRAGMSHGNVHWTANFDEIQDFENDIRGAFGGTGFMTDGDFTTTSAPLGAPKAGLSPELDALAAYVASLTDETVPRSPHRNPDGSMTAAGLAGRGVYAAMSCGSCHVEPRFTDSTTPSATLHDVGTIRTSSGSRLGAPLTGFDTPTLVGAWSTAPYFHDGSAADLDAVFRIGGGVITQAEDAIAAGGAQIVDTWVDLNNDDTVHGRAYGWLDAAGSMLTFSGIDGGSGGVGAIELRYSVSFNTTVDVVVNGTTHTLNLPGMPNNPSWRLTYWSQARVEGVMLSAGPTNTIALVGQWIGVDDMLVTTADELMLAQPHRQVLALTAQEQSDLVEYLLELDGRLGPEAGFCADGLDNDGDGDVDCDDAECAGLGGCGGIAINRSVALTPEPSPPMAFAFAVTCWIGGWELCPDEWQVTLGTELRMPGEAATGPPALWFYQHSSPVEVMLTRQGTELVIDW